MDKVLCCSISLDPFMNPIIAEDGCTYESNCWEQWCDAFTTDEVKSPNHGRLISRVVFPNHNIKEAAADWAAINRKFNYIRSTEAR